ncbi:carboxy-terminal crystallin fold protein (macronuclear) [Tetrahymena thermophila SB210]|uniref:Carboxy-terminal crystallin fold protein n=2 Tax=Tetrahymena thermophila TaxID=5911 RepID=Q22D31_TETTS|nr:carboxy-terminal crystallin fold protein [Tetrahymena thermophila SB210]ABC75093.1 C-terminal crystallin fold containing protein 4p [Tetrahymena thermophila]EAR83222.3 carboxy-terminal crystallin fold protein [Tetrahymena thermophila SB210]|eukprot:XP_001030885.3 carboxy-terminal crystallin fold protein [Tetrahymena thermophila SB210]
MQKGYILIALILLGFASANFYEIDKEFTSSTFDGRALNSWKLAGFQNSITNNCGGVSVVGGPNVVATGSMSKNFTTDFDLTSINISFDLYLFDQWLSGWEGGRDQNTLFKVFVNNQQVHQLGSDYTRQIHQKSSNICGQPDPDRLTHVSVSVPVTGRSFNVTLQANIASNNPSVASWGIRNFYILSSYGADNSKVVASELSNDNAFDVTSWTSTFQNAVTSCPNKIVGGFNVAGPGSYAVRKLSNLPPHSFLTISINAFFVDSIDSNDSIIFYVDGKIVHEETRQFFLASKNICGAGWNDNVNNKFVFLIPHFAPTAEFKIYINTDQAAGDESFGFRDLQVSADSPCPIIYEGANQQGRAFSFCGDIPDLKKIGWTKPIKGIYVPEGYAIKVYVDSNFQGKRFKVSKSNFNLTGKEYKLVNRAFNIDVNEQKLRRNE